jgi:transposase-like protein
MELNTRRRFSQDFKDDAVCMIVMEGVDVRTAAQKLGVDRSCLGRWKREYFARSGSKGASISAAEGLNPVEMEAEIRELRKQLRHSELQRTILKKALGILSQESAGDIGL